MRPAAKPKKVENGGGPRCRGVRRWLWIALRTTLAVALLAMALAAALVLGLRSRAFRGTVLELAAGALEASAGVRATARDFSLDLPRGGLELTDLTIAKPGERPFLEVERVAAAVRWRSLLGGRVEIRSLRLERPRLDLAAPLSEPPAGSGGPPALDVLEIAATGGAVSGTPPAELVPWLDAFEVDGVELAGRWVAGDLEIEIERTRIVVHSSRRPSIEAALTASFRRGAGGGLAVEGLRLAGDGLELAASGGQPAASGPAALAFELHAALERLFPDLTAGGRLDATGDLELAGGVLKGSLQADVHELPGELLEGWVQAAGRGPVLAGTVVDLDADLDLDLALAGAAPRELLDLLAGHAVVDWRRREERLLTASVRSLGAAEGGIHLAFAGEVLPALPGRRALTGEIVAPSWRAFAEGELRRGRLELELPDPAAVAARLGLAADLPWPAGTASAAVNSAGPLSSPALELDAAWSRVGQTLATLRGRSPGVANQPLRLDLTAELLPASPGRRRLTGELLVADAPRDSRWSGVHLDLELPDLSAATADLRQLWGRLLPGHELPGVLQESDLVAGGLTVAAEGSGAVLGPEVAIDARWRREPQGSLRLAAQGRLGAAPLFLGEARVELDARLAGGERLTGGGRFELRGDEKAPQTTGELSLELTRPAAAFGRLLASLRLAGGTVEAEVTTPETAGRARLRLPLGALEPAPELTAALAAFGVEPAAGPVGLDVAGLEIEALLPLFDLAADAPRPRGTIDGEMTLDPADPTAAVGRFEISGAALAAAEETLEAAGPLRLELRDRRLELAPARLAVAGVGLTVSGTAELAPRWRPADGAGALVTGLALDLAGTVELRMLAAFADNVRTTGTAEVDLEVRGPLGGLAVAGRVDGSRGTILFERPYRTKIEGPVAELSAGGGVTTLDSLRARLNGGELEASGRLAADGALTLTATLEDARYRLDSGLTARLGARLALACKLGGRSRLTGDVVVERADLVRNVLVDRELLSLLLAPGPSGWEGSDFDESVDLDLTVTTAEGLRVKNNLADLRADWSRLRVRGTVAEPLLEGRVDVDPGGRITAYGQTLRIDEASIAFSGDPVIAPRLVLETTSSLDDPSLRDDRRRFGQGTLAEVEPGSGSFWDRRRDDEVDVSKELSQGLQSYYADQFAGVLTRGLGSTELGLEALPIFGETDTQARLTATQRLSRNADLIYSVNPREAEAQTTLLDLHGFDFAPSVTAQFFNNDAGHKGLALVQTMELVGGRRTGGRRSVVEEPRLAAIAIAAPGEVSLRSLRRALALRRGDAFPEGTAFDVEIDALEELRRQGFPGAEVAIAVEPAGHRRVRLGVAVEPGPEVGFDFAGDRPPRVARGAIVQVYDPANEETSLEELRRDTVEALRAEGYLDPRVDVTAAPARNGARTVRIRAEGGRKVDPRVLRLTGLPAPEAEIVAGQITSRRARVELAAGAPAADRFLLRALTALGYPDARIASRQVDREELVVSVEPGRRLRLAAIEIVGLPPEEAAQWVEALPVRAGDPVRSDQVTRAVYALEDALRARGLAAATVRAVLEPTAGGDRLLRLEVEPGPLHRLAGLRIEGLAGSRAEWAEHTAGLDPGGLFQQEQVGQARRRLSRTGRFERIGTTLESSGSTRNLPPGPPGGAADFPPGPPGGAAGDSVETTVVFDVEERPRFVVAYGGRWESGESVGAVVEMVDHSFRGRGQVFGARAGYAGDRRRSFRLYHAVPRFRGGESSLEAYGEAKKEEIEGFLVDSVEGWGQITTPLGRRTRNRFYLRVQDLFFREIAPRVIDPEPAPGQRLLIPSVGWQLTYDATTTAERRERPLGAGGRNGLFYSLDLVGTHEVLGSDLSVVGLFTQVKTFVTLPGIGARHGGATWAQSFRVGLLEPFGGVVIPSIERLRAGGEYSVRGYRTESLGPLDDEGKALGGEVFFVVNQELHVPLRRESLSGLLFFDAGNVWASRAAIDSELFTSVGLGVRAETPIGKLRFDLAFPLDRRRDLDDSYKLYVGFANIF